MIKVITTLLITLCSTVRILGQDNNEKLYKAIIKGDTTIVMQLLNSKADPNYIIVKGPWMKVNMLITAVNNGNISIVKMLITMNADVKWKDGFKTTALMYAASKGSKEIVALLLNNGADVNDNDGQGNTVLSAAKESKNNELIRFIEETIKKTIQ